MPPKRPIQEMQIPNKTASPDDIEGCGDLMMVGETGFESNIEPQRIYDTILTEQDRQGQNTSYPLISENISKIDAAATATEGGAPLTDPNQSELPIYVQQNRLQKIAAFPDLGKVVDSWKGLPEHIREAIILLIRSAATD